MNEWYDRCSDTIETFRDKAVVVSSQSIEEAIEWLNEWNVSSVRSLKNTITCEATMIAFQDKLVNANCSFSLYSKVREFN